MLNAIDRILSHYHKSYFIIDESYAFVSKSRDIKKVKSGFTLPNKINISDNISLWHIFNYLPNQDLDPVLLHIACLKGKGTLNFYCIRFENTKGEKRFIFLAAFKEGKMLESIPNIHLQLQSICDMLEFMSNGHYIGHYVSNSSNTIIHIEEDLATRLGYSQQELVGERLVKILPNIPEKGYDRELIQFEESSYLIKGIAMKVDKKGKSYLFNKLVFPLYTIEDGHLDSYIKMLGDIPKDDGPSVHSNELLETIPISSISEKSLTTDVTGRINWVSDDYLTLSGYTYNEIVGNDMFMFTGEKTDIEKVQNMLAYFANGGDFYEWEDVGYKKSGKMYTCTTKVTKVFRQNGEHLGYLLNIFEKSSQEIDKKRFEQLKKICDLSKECMVITDAHGKIEWANPEFLKKTGYPLEEILGKTPGSMLQGPKTNPIDVEAFRRKLRLGEDFNQTITNYSKTGVEYKTVVFISTIKNSAGKVTNFLGIQHFVDQRAKSIKGSNDEVLLTVMQQLSVQYEELCKKQEDIEMQNNALNESYQMLSNLNHKVKSSINYAKRLQSSIMPNQYFIENKLGSAFIINRPKDMVSGDFYWFNENEDRIRLIIGDCTGHGVSGAFMTILVTGLLDRYVSDTKLEFLPRAFDNLNKAMRAKLINNAESLDATVDGFEFGMLQIDKLTGQYHYLGAKMDLIKISDKGIKTIKAHRFPIGGNYRLYKNKKFTKIHSFTPEPGECIYLYSDGYPDQFNDANTKKVTTKRFKDLLFKYHSTNVDQQRLKLLEVFKNWKGRQPQTDDVIVFGFRPDKFKVSKEKISNKSKNTGLVI